MREREREKRQQLGRQKSREEGTFSTLTEIGEVVAEVVEVAEVVVRSVDQPHANTEDDRSPRNDSQRRAPPGKCFRYGETGHWKRHCPKKQTRTSAVVATAVSLQGAISF